MSAKVIYSFTDENPDLQKQIGCMNGIFQLFDRHHFLTGGWRASQKRLPLGQSDNDYKQASRSIQTSKDSNPKKEAKEKHRSSTESSRTSFSSSTCSSTFSSLDCNKIALLEPSKQSGHKSFDLRDIVKESINKEARGLSVNTVSKEPERHTMKHIDSPRPLQLSKTMKPRGLNLKESSQSPVKSKDAPRFSYDGRESKDIKLKELPRLSLDSRESRTRGSTYEFKSNHLTGNQMENEKNRRAAAINPHEETGSCCKRPSSVVAKLMGLDALPNSMLSTGGNNTYEKRISCSQRNLHQADTSVQSPTLKNVESTIKAQNSSCPSVYGEIEKRLADLEFRKSGKDLRALKQILQAMQKNKETLEIKQDQITCSSPSLSTQDHSSKIENRRNLRNKPPISAVLKQTSPRKTSGSPTVIIKPATLASKYSTNPIIEGISALNKLRTGDVLDKQTYKDRTLTPRDSPRGTSNRFQCSTDKSFRTRIKTPETSGKSSGSLSPGLQCKELRPTTSLSYSSRTIRESSRHSTETKSHRRKIRLSSPSRENITRDRCLTQQSDAKSLKSESSSSFLSQMDTEISSTENYEEIISHKHRNPDTPEQPSPVSVLDAMFYRDDLPSPVKMISHNIEAGDDGALFSDEPFRTSAILHQISDSVGSNLNFDIEELFQNKTEDHTYISKIFLASRLLSRDISTTCLMTIQLHPTTDYIINPDLFFALEQRSPQKSKSISTHRKLIFDTVNEILVGKLVSRNLTANGQQLLKEVCSEIDELQVNSSSSNSNLDNDSDFFSNILWEDLKNQSASWTALGSDVSGLVLDIERSIFKDLVTEIVDEEATVVMRTRIGGRGRRKLFAR